MADLGAVWARHTALGNHYGSTWLDVGGPDRLWQNRGGERNGLGLVAGASLLNEWRNLVNGAIQGRALVASLRWRGNLSPRLT